MQSRGPIEEDSDARVWSGVNEEVYQFEAQAERFRLDGEYDLESGDVIIDHDRDQTLTFRHAERTLSGQWTLIFDASDGRVLSGGPAVHAIRFRDGDWEKQPEDGEN